MSKAPQNHISTSMDFGQFEIHWPNALTLADLGDIDEVFRILRRQAIRAARRTLAKGVAQCLIKAASGTPRVYAKELDGPELWPLRKTG